MHAGAPACDAVFESRARRSQMLADEPNNKNLLDLREQLTNAIAQLQVQRVVPRRPDLLLRHTTVRARQGTKEMVNRTTANNRRPGAPGIGQAFGAGTTEKARRAS